MPVPVLLDTSFLISLADPGRPHHGVANFRGQSRLLSRQLRRVPPTRTPSGEGAPVTHTEGPVLDNRLHSVQIHPER